MRAEDGKSAISGWENTEVYSAEGTGRKDARKEKVLRRGIAVGSLFAV